MILRTSCNCAPCVSVFGDTVSPGFRVLNEKRTKTINQTRRNYRNLHHEKITLRSAPEFPPHQLHGSSCGSDSSHLSDERRRNGPGQAVMPRFNRWGPYKITTRKPCPPSTDPQTTKPGDSDQTPIHPPVLATTTTQPPLHPCARPPTHAPSPPSPPTGPASPAPSSGKCLPGRTSPVRTAAGCSRWGSSGPLDTPSTASSTPRCACPLGKNPPAQKTQTLRPKSLACRVRNVVQLGGCQWLEGARACETVVSLSSPNNKAESCCF